MKRLTILLTIVFALSLTSCTQNSRAKTFGGEATLELPKGQKLEMVTWKDDNLWYLTTNMTATDVPKTYTFQEESSWGMWEGIYTIKETK